MAPPKQCNINVSCKTFCHDDNNINSDGSSRLESLNNLIKHNIMSICLGKFLVMMIMIIKHNIITSWTIPSHDDSDIIRDGWSKLDKQNDIIVS